MLLELTPLILDRTEALVYLDDGLVQQKGQILEFVFFPQPYPDREISSQNRFDRLFKPVKRARQPTGEKEPQSQRYTKTDREGRPEALGQSN